MLGLCCCTQAFSACGRGLLTVVASLVAEHRLCSAGSVVVVHRLNCLAACEIFPDQGQACVPCIGRWVLNQWTTREVHWLLLLSSLSFLGSTIKSVSLLLFYVIWVESACSFYIVWLGTLSSRLFVQPRDWSLQTHLPSNSNSLPSVCFLFSCSCLCWCQSSVILFLLC